MTISFDAEVIFWHGPSPFLFAPMPAQESAMIRTLANELSYGWGCIPVEAKLGETEWRTSLMPKNGRYLVPLKVKVQVSEQIVVGKSIHISLKFRE